MQKNIQLYILVFIFYALTASLAMHKVLLQSVRLPGAAYGNKFQTDYYHFHWNYWWIRHALTHNLNVYETDYVMYPHTVNLAYHSLTPIYFPIWAFFEPIFGTISAVNIIIVLSMTLMGWSLFVLARQVQVPIGFALVGGLVFQLLPTHWNAIYLTNLNYLSMFWLPIHFVLLKKHYAQLNTPQLSLFWCGVIAFSFYGTLLSDPQIILYNAPMLIIFGATQLYLTKSWQRRLRLVSHGVLAISLFVGLAWFVGPLRYLLDFNQAPPAQETAEGAFKIPFPAGFYQRLPEYWLTRDFLSLGSFVLPFTALSLGLGLWQVRRKRTADERWFWLLASLIPLILSAGAMISINGYSINLPYRYLHHSLGGLFRQPARFVESFTVGAMIFAGLVWGDFLNKRSQKLVVMLLIIVVLAEANIFVSVPTQQPPVQYKFYAEMGREKGEPYDDYIVLEVPTGAWSGEWGVGTQDFVTLQFNAITHQKRVVNGFVARVPSQYFLYMETSDPVLAWLGQRRLLEPALVEAQLQTMIYDWPIGYIVVHQDLIGLDSPATIEIIGYLNSLDDLVCPYAIEGDAIAYRTAWHPDGCPERTPPQIEPDLYQITIGQQDEAFLGWGFYYAEQIFDTSFRWTGASPEATLYVDLPPGDYLLSFKAQSFFEEQSVDVLVNGTLLDSISIHPNHLDEYQVHIPAPIIDDGQHVTITFIYANALAPAEVNLNSDPRSLALMFEWVQFKALK